VGLKVYIAPIYSPFLMKTSAPRSLLPRIDSVVCRKQFRRKERKQFQLRLWTCITAARQSQTGGPTSLPDPQVGGTYPARKLLPNSPCHSQRGPLIFQIKKSPPRCKTVLERPRRKASWLSISPPLRHKFPTLLAVTRPNPFSSSPPPIKAPQLHFLSGDHNTRAS
jgi:hypothetical protein